MSTSLLALGRFVIATSCGSFAMFVILAALIHTHLLWLAAIPFLLAVGACARGRS